MCQAYFSGEGRGVGRQILRKLTQIFQRKTSAKNAKIPVDRIVVIPKSKEKSKGVNQPATAYWLHRYGLQ